MDENERHAEGIKVRRAVLGDAHVDRAMATTTDVTAELQDLITRYAWGEIWTRPGLDVRTRRVLAIGTMIALGRWDELRLHVRAALTEGGFSADAVKEIVLQQAIYCGVPTAHASLGAIREILEDPGEGDAARGSPTIGARNLDMTERGL
jgi:4-carboxymuconolactone decarboxylase/3-oxoadipate enol-lactonase/4-carboxymuconolactone decarboxylase